MRFKTLFAVCALFGSLFQSSPSLSETLRTAWLGEHEAFLTWYAKEKGWDKEAGLDIIMLRFDSGKSLIENVRAYDWAIARSEERRVGKECLPRCRSRWSPYH